MKKNVNGHYFVDLDYKKELKKNIEFDKLSENLYSVIISENDKPFALVYGESPEVCYWNANLVESSKKLVKGIENAVLMFTRLGNERKKDLQKEIDFLIWQLTELRNRAVSVDSKNKYIDKNNLNKKI